MLRKILILSAVFMLLAFALSVNRSFAYLTSNVDNHIGPAGTISSPINISLLTNLLDYFKNSSALSGLFKGASLGSFASSFFNVGSFSSGDIFKALKSIITLAINLFLIVIQTAAGVLKALLPFLSK